MKGIKVKGVRGSIKEPIILKENDAGCWICINRKPNPDGYQRLRWDGKGNLMHRFFFEYYKGKIPAGKCVCHSCDNPGCLNPDHLFLGTNPENTADRHGKGRTAKGSQVGTSVLTAEEALAIRRSNESGPIMAKRYGISRSTVSAIRRGRSWKHLEATI